jgi:indole-3-glycerol phosphate synthase
MSSRLATILDTVRPRVDALRGRERSESLRARARDMAPTRNLAAALRRPGKGEVSAAPIRVIGELKRRSPSAGSIRENLDPIAAARALETAGCRALSVLTEPHFFGGSLETLAAVRETVELPLLRKDFILDPLQILEARAHGADAVLLLAAALDDAALTRCAEAAAEWDLSVLAEAHGPDELDRLLALDFPIVGVNARDLRSFDVDLPRALRWCAQIPADRIVVAESGVRQRAEADAVAAAPVDAALVGEGLMRPGTPGERFAELFGPERAP